MYSAAASQCECSHVCEFSVQVLSQLCSFAVSWIIFLLHLLWKHLHLRLKGFSSHFFLMTLSAILLFTEVLLRCCAFLVWVLWVLLGPSCNAAARFPFRFFSPVFCCHLLFILLRKLAGKEQWEVTDPWLHSFLDIACWSCSQSNSYKKFKSHALTAPVF